MVEAGRFYSASDQRSGSHLALSLKGRVRYTVPRAAAAREACWKTFRPGRLELPLRVMARMPRLFGVASCVEGEDLITIREALGKETGPSCCRTGAAGVWSKDTILFLDKAARPLYIVKAGFGEAVDGLLQNEADWLRRLRAQPGLANHIPELIAHRAGTELCFVAQCALPGDIDFTLGEPQFEFIHKLQDSSLKTMRYEDSRLYENYKFRMRELSGLLPLEWSTRLESAIRRIENVFQNSPPPFTDAHNDFTPWNIRVERGTARVFDWEYAEREHLPLFDPLHFALMPMILKREPPEKIVRGMRQMLQLCAHRLGKERCKEAETQALAYFVNLGLLYLWSVRGVPESHPIFDSCSEIIDRLVRE